MGHARALEPQRLPARHAPRALRAALREWLVLLGYEVVADAQLPVSAVPGAAGSHAEKARAGCCAGDLTYPLPASAYLLKARKRIYTLTPIRPRFREKPAVLGGLVKPTTRSGL